MVLQLFYNGVIAVLQWCVAVVSYNCDLHLCCSGVTVVYLLHNLSGRQISLYSVAVLSQWCYRGVTVVLP
jgi:hypothetical protein